MVLKNGGWSHCSKKIGKGASHLSLKFVNVVVIVE